MNKTFGQVLLKKFEARAHTGSELPASTFFIANATPFVETNEIRPLVLDIQSTLSENGCQVTSEAKCFLFFFKKKIKMRGSSKHTTKHPSFKKLSADRKHGNYNPLIN